MQQVVTRLADHFIIHVIQILYVKAQDWYEIKCTILPPVQLDYLLSVSGEERLVQSSLILKSTPSLVVIWYRYAS